MSTPRPAAPATSAVPRTLPALPTAALSLLTLVGSAARAQGAPGGGAAPRPSDSAGTAAAAPSRVLLRGTVYDSLARGPLVGAIIQAVRVDNTASARSTSTDSTGAFALDSLAPGRYLLGFLHPTLDLLGLQVTPVVVVADGRALPPITLAVPGPTTIYSAVCQPNARGDSTGAVAGLVRNALTGDAAAGATVVVSWTEVDITRQGLAREPHRVPVKVREDGGFVVCGVPAGEAVQLSAGAPGLTSGLVEVTAPARGLVVQSFAIGPVARGGASPNDSVVIEDADGVPRPAAGTARLAGRVVGPDGQPLRGARARVWGTAAHAETGPDGRFALADLPAGTFTLEVIGIGLEPSRTPVDLASGQTAEVRVAMAKPAAQLERVSVVGKATERSRFLEEFERRRHTGQGQYYTAAEIEKSGAVELTDVIRSKGVPSLRVIPRGARGNVLRGRAGCVPNVWLDGNLIRGGANEIDDLVPAKGVEAIEVYGSGATIPAQFNITGSGGSLQQNSPVTCGAVVIWTMR